MPEEIKQLIEKTFGQRPSRYGRRPERLPFDDALSDFVRTVVNRSPAHRSDVSAALSTDERNVLRVFARRMAEFAVREQSQSQLVNGLIAIIIGNLEPDYREDDMVLSLLFRSAEKLELSPMTLIEQLAPYSDKGVMDHIRAYVIGGASIEDMGYSESMDGQGFAYRRHW